MWNDPIVAEVRRARLEIEKECEEDFARIYARALEVQKNAGVKLVSRPGTDKITMREIGWGDYGVPRGEKALISLTKMSATSSSSAVFYRHEATARLEN
jgi:hypothetical protein